MSVKVFVDGQEGTTGLQIEAYLGRRHDIERLRIEPELRKDARARARLLNAADVAFLCLPDAAAREAVTLLDNPGTCLIDASSAHRIDPDWVFGLPELEPQQRESIRAAKRIANPGCHATAFILLVRPLIDAGLLPADYPLSCFSLTGYSGGGKKLIEQYRNRAVPPGGAAGAGGARWDSPRQYALGMKHKHLPEMVHHCRLASSPVFAPVVADFYKGLSVSIGLRASLMLGNASLQTVHRALAERYTDECFVHVRPVNDPEVRDDGYFDVQGCNDTNRVDLFVFGNDEQIMLISRMDNLGKGASGAAVQSMNIHLGVDEALGLD